VREFFFRFVILITLPYLLPFSCCFRHRNRRRWP